MVPATCYSQQKLISGCTGCYGWRAAVASIFSTCFCCHQMLCRFVLTKCLMFAQKVCSNSKGQGGVNMIALPEHFAWQPQAQQALVNGIARCLPTGPNSRRVKLFKYPSVCGQGVKPKRVAVAFLKAITARVMRGVAWPFMANVAISTARFT